MFKIYMRLLGFASSIKMYAVPYFIFSALHALFNTFNYAMIIPILNTMFDKGFQFVPVYDMPEFSLSGEKLQLWLNYAYTHIFNANGPEDWDIANVLILLKI